MHCTFRNNVLYYGKDKTKIQWEVSCRINMYIHRGHLPIAICQTLSEETTYTSENHTHLRTALFWAITRCVVVIPYRRFRAPYRSSLKGPIGCLETSSEITTTRCVIVQKGTVQFTSRRKTEIMHCKHLISHKMAYEY
jgi:hypothetical protein